jgi:hypothetical protein
MLNAYVFLDAGYYGHKVSWMHVGETIEKVQQQISNQLIVACLAPKGYQIALGRLELVGEISQS